MLGLPEAGRERIVQHSLWPLILHVAVVLVLVGAMLFFALILLAGLASLERLVAGV